MRWMMLVWLSLSGFLWAQHNNRSARDLQFRFGNPGARSLGFGGAFLGLADDATAPVVNPAGMVRTSKRSAAFELNYNRQENVVPFQSGEILQTNIFEFEYNFQTSKATEDIYQIPYLSAVFPANRWRLGFFAHQQANLQRSYTTDSIIICDFAANFYPNCENDPSPDANPPSSDVLDMRMINLGGSLAYAFSERFSIGASVFYSDLDYQADSRIEFPQVVGVALVDKLARGDDRDWGGILGALWQVFDEFSVGLTYKRQPEFQYTAELIKSRPVPNVPGDFVALGDFKIPDSLGFGISIRPVENVTINVDADRVYYSQVTDDLIDFSQILVSDNTLVTQQMPDVTEIHLGFEWIFAGLAYPISLRLGYWLDPYHAATNTIEDSQILEGPINDPGVRDIFFLHQFEEDDEHYALGLGWTFSRKFQFDFALETADSGDNATASGVYRF